MPTPGGGDGGVSASPSFHTPMTAARYQPYKLTVPTPSSGMAAPQSLGSVSSFDSSPGGARKGTFSDDEDWELAMIRKEVAMLERTTGAASGNLPGSITPTSWRGTPR